MNLQTLKNRNSQKGFTIVELLIVIVVIAILAAISIAAYTGVQNRSRDSAALQSASQVEKKAKAFHAVKGAYPATIAAFDDTDVAEAKLEGIRVLSAVPAAGTDDLKDFNNGKLVVYTVTGTAPNVVPSITYYKTGGNVTKAIN